jgi:hypothetical protein
MGGLHNWRSYRRRVAFQGMIEHPALSIFFPLDCQFECAILNRFCFRAQRNILMGQHIKGITLERISTPHPNQVSNRAPFLSYMRQRHEGYTHHA